MKKKFYTLSFLLSVALYTAISCKKESNIGSRVTNSASPVANAGNDTIIVLPLDSVVLNGEASQDADGNIESYHWSKILGPTAFTIVNSESAKTALKHLSEGTYEFELTVSDKTGLRGKDTVMITVDKRFTSNHTPIAYAGVDITINLPVNTVELDGSRSIDPDYNITAFTWTKVDGPGLFNIADANAMRTSASALIKGVYQFELKVTDAGGLIGRDTVTITVKAPNTTVPCDTRPLINARLESIGSLSDSRINLVAGAAGNKVLFAGGWVQGGHSTRVDIYDISTKTWTTAELTVAERDGMAVAAVGNKVFFAGGGNNDWTDVTSRIDIYDASANTWSTAELKQPRNYLSAATIANKVFFAGGGIWGPLSSGAPPSGWPPTADYHIGSDVVDIYDNSTNTWSTAHLSQGRFELSATTAGNKVYFAGGIQNIFTGSQVIDVFDVSTNAWSTSELLEPRTSHAAVAMNDKIYWAGGANSPYYSGFDLSGFVEIKDLNTGVSTLKCFNPKSHFRSVIKDDQIIFFTGLQPSDKFDIYNTTTNTWSTGVLPVSIGSSAIISVDNTIYVAGGSVNGAYSDMVWKLEF